MQRSCSSLRVSVKRVSPARDDAMIPALDTSESVSVDFPWSTWAITDMFRMLDFLSMMARIWSTVKFTWMGWGGYYITLIQFFHNQHRFSLFIICIYLFMTTTRCHFKWSYKKKDMLETESIRLTARTECEDLTVWFLNKQTGSGLTESPLTLQLNGPFQNHPGTKSLHFTP